MEGDDDGDQMMGNEAVRVGEEEEGGWVCCV